MVTRLFFVAATTLAPIVSNASEETEIKAAIAQAEQPKGDFKAALDYRMKALNILGERLDRAMGRCTTDRKILFRSKPWYSYQRQAELIVFYTRPRARSARALLASSSRFAFRRQNIRHMFCH
jgi:hypothetical protein